MVDPNPSPTLDDGPAQSTPLLSTSATDKNTNITAEECPCDAASLSTVSTATTQDSPLKERATLPPLPPVHIVASINHHGISIPLFLQPFFGVDYLPRVPVKKRISKSEAARRIQRIFRGYQCRSKYTDTRKCIIILQSYIRMVQTLQLQQKQIRNVIVLQAFVRMVESKYHLAQARQAAVVIQCSYRCHRARMAMNKTKEAKEEKEKEIERLRIEKERLRIEHERAMEKARQEREKAMNQAATLIQCCVRMLKARIAYIKNEKARIVQAAYRGYWSRSRYLKVRRGVISVQKRYRKKKVAQPKRRKMARRNSFTEAVQWVSNKYYG